jgi:predicted small metal-binding protein
MTKSIKCTDAGKDCPWSATAKTVDDLMVQVMSHVKNHHKEIELNAENISKIKSLIKEV